MKQFEDKELVLMAQIIDASSQRGIFKGPDLKTVGEMYEKICEWENVLRRKSSKTVNIE